LIRDDPVDRALVAALSERGDSWGMTSRAQRVSPVEALAALYFLSPSAAVPIVLATVPADDRKAAEDLGAAIAAATASAPRRAALCAVGELSSRLFRGAPGGYSQDAGAFDRQVVELLHRGGAGAVGDLSSDAREEAAESIVPQLVALGAALSGGEEAVLSYEGSFGVGYIAAAWRPAAPV
jgi:MEMO1 family protein